MDLKYGRGRAQTRHLAAEVPIVLGWTNKDNYVQNRRVQVPLLDHTNFRQFVFLKRHEHDLSWNLLNFFVLFAMPH
jgi:hypothetical protein